MDQRFLTPDEVASLLRVSSEAVRRLLRRGEIPAIRVGRAWRIDAEAFQRWLRRGLARGRRGGDGRGGPCLCGCGQPTITPAARFLPGHDGKLVHRLMTERGLSFEAARDAVRHVHRPRIQEKLF